MFESYGVYALVAGIVLTVAGYLWLIIRAWQIHWGWLVGILLVPLVIPIFIVIHFRRAALPGLVLLCGVTLVGGTVGANLYLANRIDLGPREKIVNGELHITITGWDNPLEDYAVLATKQNVVVLQMANPDVTDETVKFLTDLQQLEELDVNDTKITDNGLAIIGQLPKLRVLRVRGTQVTDDGFREHLMGKETLREIDVRETEIASKTMRQWKSEQKGLRRYLK